MAGLKDIAEACGISVASVSKALRDYKDISEETRRVVQKTARQMGYTPKYSVYSQGAVGRKAVGIIYKDRNSLGLQHDFFAAMLESFKLKLWENGYDIVLLSMKNPCWKTAVMEQCMKSTLSGILIMCADYEDPDIEELVQSDYPVVTIDHVFDECSAVTSDNGEGMRQLMDYVLNRGHRLVAYVHGEASSVTRARLTSFYFELARNGLTVPDSYVRSASYRGIELARSETRHLMQLHKPPTCIFYPDDVSCMGGMRWLEENGFKVGTDISVVGYDGGAVYKAGCPELTTYEQDPAGMGVEAALQMLRLICEEENPLPVHSIVGGKLHKGSTVCKISD